MKKYINISLEKSLYILAVLLMFMVFLFKNIYTNGTVNILEMFHSILGIAIFCMLYYIPHKILE